MPTAGETRVRNRQREVWVESGGRGRWEPYGTPEPEEAPQDSGREATPGSKWETLGKLAQDRTPKEQLSTGDLENMTKMLKGVLSLTVLTKDNMDTVLDMLALEDTLRVDISKSLGMSNAQLLDTIDGLTEAGLEASRFGLTTHNLFETFKKMSVAISRITYIPPEATERAALLTKTLDGFDAGAFAEAFDTIGYSLGTAMGKVDETDNAMSEILQTGREFGVVMGKIPR